MSLVFRITALSLVLGAVAAHAQTLRYDSEALNRVRRGSEADSEYVSRLLNQSMSFVRSEHDSCSHSSGVDGTNLKNEQDKKRQREQICAIIEPLNPDTRFKFDGSDFGKICEPFWQDGKPPWVRNPELLKTINNYNTPNFIPPSRTQLMKQGFVPMTDVQKQEYLTRIETFREKAARFCCDSLGSEGKECTQAIRDVKIEICRDEATEKDPSRPDSCSKVNAAFHRSTPENVQILKQMLRDGEKAQQVKRSTFEQFKQQFSSYLESDEVKAMNVVARDKIVSGKIVLSPYFKDGAPLAVPSTVAHEFMHACSLVRKQLDVKHNSLFADASMQVTIGEHKNSCDVSAATVESYGGMLSHFKTDGPDLSGCLTKMALKSTDKKSSVFVRSSCQRRKVEEGFADAGGIFLVEPAIPDGFPNRACEFLPSTQHPHPSETAQCMIAYLPSYKKLVQEAFQCKVSPQQ